VRARQAVALAPFDLFALMALSYTLQDLDRPAEAVPHTAKACSLARAGWACASYATMLLRAGRKSEALAAAGEAGRMTEGGPLRYNLACFWAVAGDRNQALRDLKRAIDLGYVSALRGAGPRPGLAARRPGIRGDRRGREAASRNAAEVKCSRVAAQVDALGVRDLFMSAWPVPDRVDLKFERSTLDFQV
jgi:hypothetical protein